MCESGSPQRGRSSNKGSMMHHAKRRRNEQKLRSSAPKKRMKTVCLKSRLEKESDVGVRILFQPSLLSDYDEGSVWKNGKVDYNCGLIAYSSRGDISDSELAEGITQRLCIRELVDNGVESMRIAVCDFLCETSDTLEQVIDAVDKVENYRGQACTRFGEEDLRWWNANYERRRYYRVLTFFRRLLKPLSIQFVVGETLVLRRSKVSLLDAMLNTPELCEFVMEAMLLHACCLYQVAPELSEERILLEQMLHLVSKTVNSGKACIMNAYSDIARFVLKITPQLSDRVPFMPRSRSPERDEEKTHYALKTKIWNKYLVGLERMDSARVINPYGKQSSKSGDPETIESHRKFLAQRQHLIDERKIQILRHRKQGSQIHAPAKSLPSIKRNDKSLQYTDLDFSFHEFAKKTRFMNLVNESFPRLVIPGESRPRLQQIHLPAEKLQNIKRLLFDDDGGLSEAVRNDIDYSLKHGYINFENMLCLEQRQDKRWQVPIRKHSQGGLVHTRNAIEQILAGVINLETETLDDLGIIIGGTEDQPLHHDLARQLVTWLPEQYLESEGSGIAPVGGWEIERLAYNEAMEMENAPASILIGMNDKAEVLLGVQKDQIVRVNEPYCFVKGGVENELFEIVRENEFLVVVRVDTGVMFTGDFPHAGVRNAQVNSTEELLITALNRRIALVRDIFPEGDLLGQRKAVVDVLCKFPKLDQLCRLHCSTTMTSFNLSVPSNTIGFCDCLANAPDSRCLNDDIPIGLSSDLPTAQLSCDGRLDESDDEAEWDDTLLEP